MQEFVAKSAKYTYLVISFDMLKDFEKMINNYLKNDLIKYKQTKRKA